MTTNQKAKPREKRITFSEAEAQRFGLSFYRDYFTGKIGCRLNGQILPNVEVEFKD